jgi:hypothetical protein
MKKYLLSATVMLCLSPMSSALSNFDVAWNRAQEITQDLLWNRAWDRAWQNMPPHIPYTAPYMPPVMSAPHIDLGPWVTYSLYFGSMMFAALLASMARHI